MRVLRTTSQEGYVVRRRKCPACGLRVTTSERPHNQAPPGQTAIDSGLLQLSIAQIHEAVRLLADGGSHVSAERAESGEKGKAA